MYSNVWKGYNQSRACIFYLTKTWKLLSGDFFGAKVILTKEIKFGNSCLETWKISNRQEIEESAKQAVVMPWDRDTCINPEHIFCEYESYSVHRIK